MLELLTRAAVRAALIGSSLAERRLFWVRAALGTNQLKMHDCSPDGTISIGGVSEQLYGEGFVAAWHEVLARELGSRLPDVLYEVGVRGARWEVQQAIDHAVWVPRLLRPFVGKPALLEKVASSDVYHALMRESLAILFRMIMTEGGWGVVEEIDLRSRPMRLEVSNTPEPRRLGRTGKCECHLMRGIYAGYFSTLFGATFAATESTCRSAGDRLCTFELSPVKVEKPAPVETVAVGAAAAGGDGKRRLPIF